MHFVSLSIQALFEKSALMKQLRYKAAEQRTLFSP